MSLSHTLGIRKPPPNVMGVRDEARRRLPRPVFDFIDGGAEDEITLRDNSSAFSALRFRPQALTDVSVRTQRTSVLGLDLAMPVMMAPAGLARMAHREGELAAARAAGRNDTVFTVSTASSYSLEEIAAVASGPLWFQLYVWQDREATRDLVTRARNSGYEAICFTIDVPLSGQRERDLRHGLTMPPRPGLASAMQYARHPWWVKGALVGSPITFRNFLGEGGRGDGAVSLGSYVNAQLNPSMCWDDLAWLREMWDGTLVVKGVMTGADARQAVDAGADAVIVSNHGGRQLDGLPATIDVLPEVVAAVGTGAEVLIDGGIRRGSDVIKALALGARACMIGRPYLYGLAMDGEDGASRVLEMFRTEIDRTQALLGVPDLGKIHADILRLPPSD